MQEVTFEQSKLIELVFPSETSDRYFFQESETSDVKIITEDELMLYLSDCEEKCPDAIWSYVFYVDDVMKWLREIYKIDIGISRPSKTKKSYHYIIISNYEANPYYQEESTNRTYEEARIDAINYALGLIIKHHDQTNKDTITRYKQLCNQVGDVIRNHMSIINMTKEELAYLSRFGMDKVSLILEDKFNLTLKDISILENVLKITIFKKIND